MSEYGFYMVWNPQGRAPTHKHQTSHDALIEAKRLASLNREQEFYVLKAVKCVEVKEPVEVTELEDPDDEIPF